MIMIKRKIKMTTASQNPDGPEKPGRKTGMKMQVGPVNFCLPWRALQINFRAHAGRKPA